MYERMVMTVLRHTCVLKYNHHSLFLCVLGGVESELLHTYIKVDPLDTLILCVRMAVLVAVTLTVPVVLFPVRLKLQAGRGGQQLPEQCVLACVYVFLYWLEGSSNVTIMHPYSEVTAV